MTFEELKDSLQLSLDRMLKFLDNKPGPENGHYDYWLHAIEEELRILGQRLDLLEEWLKKEQLIT